MTAKIIDMPQRDDDVIPVDSGVPLIDADPVVIARRLGPETWETRARFFNNIVGDGLNTAITMIEYLPTGERQRAANDWFILKTHQRIGQTLDLWGEAKPSEDLAAVIFALSLNPEHRHAARGYFHPRPELPSQQVRRILAGMDPLRVFFNMSEISRPGLSHAWRSGVPESDGVAF